MRELIAESGSSAWSYGGSILTFLFPMILFIAVAGALYVLYSKPHIVPGHRYLAAGRSVAATPMPTPGPEDHERNGPGTPRHGDGTKSGQGPAESAGTEAR